MTGVNMYFSRTKVENILNNSGFNVKVKKISQIDSGYDKYRYAAAYLVTYFVDGGSILSNVFLMYYERNGDIVAELQ
jgi:hypothetical protein